MKVKNLTVPIKLEARGLVTLSNFHFNNFFFQRPLKIKASSNENNEIKKKALNLILYIKKKINKKKQIRFSLFKLLFFC